MNCDCLTQMSKRFDVAHELLEAFWAVRPEMPHIPVDIEGICNFQNIKLVKSNSEDDFVGKVSQTGRGEVTIVINMNKNAYSPRYRFTLAHEIAHFNLHLREGMFQEYEDSELTLLRKEDNWSPQEAEANRFAAQLLMPAMKIIEEAQRIITEKRKEDGLVERKEFVRVMANRFDVSNMAMEFRLLNMGILDE